MKNMCAIVAIMAVFTLAVCFIMTGSISEELKSKLGIDNSAIGTMVFIFSLTCMIVQLLVGPLVDRIGHKPLAVLGFLVAGISIFILAFAQSFALVLAAAVLLGIGAICCNTVGNTLLPVVLFDGKEPSRASNFGNAFVGLAFVLIPLTIVTLINDLGWSYERTLSIIASVVLIFAVFAFISNYPRVSTGFELAKAVRLLSQPLVLLAALALVCYIGLEFSMSTWIKPLMTELYEKTGNTNAVRDAGRILALFGLAMAVGRFLTSMVKNLSQIGTFVVAGGALVVVGSVMIMVCTANPRLVALAVLVTGLAFAPMFPTIVGVTFSKYDAGLYGSIFGIIFSIGLLGSMILPKLIGSLSVNKTVQQSLPITAIMAGVLLIIALLMGRAYKRHNK
ncbi:MAG: MFS transporter [Planctomycetes bacterium]|nr:MFS transporter [Planctomycetota bacterium]MBL7145988.1 MFS transporter [Phycisphaerae bacterium]